MVNCYDIDSTIACDCKLGPTLLDRWGNLVHVVENNIGDDSDGPHMYKKWCYSAILDENFCCHPKY